ncbi:MGMT family protein [Lysinimonas soli]|uniref:MGMT family protein n=1 Tax=Lysinimonas soli TaxID=1074233 RepID=A0ABW0NR59_9MICO
MPPREPNPEFAEAVLAVVASIPPGMVMSYGDVAAAIGSRAPRAVGAVMAWYGGDVPWWRVVRASGHPVADHEARALEYYRTEGTPLRWSGDSFRIDLATARHDPSA